MDSSNEEFDDEDDEDIGDYHQSSERSDKQENDTSDTINIKDITNKISKIVKKPFKEKKYAIKSKIDYTDENINNFETNINNHNTTNFSGNNGYSTKISKKEKECQENFKENYGIDNIGKIKFVAKSSDKRFGKIDEEIGFGSFKRVYRGFDFNKGREVAWNTINVSEMNNEDLSRIREEVNIMKNLNHSNIINYISGWFDKQRNEVVIITEIICGGSLKKYLYKVNNPRLKLIKHWIKEILIGLKYLHTEVDPPIMHRDIKCDNIFIDTTNGRITIGDLGLSKVQNESCTKSFGGTEEFIAPEVYQGKYTTLADIYSLGMCILEMVTLEIPYKEYDSNLLKIYECSKNGIPPKSLEKIKNKDLKLLITSCLKPQNERPTAEQLLNSEFLKEISNVENNFPVELYDEFEIQLLNLEIEKEKEKEKEIELQNQINIIKPDMCIKNDELLINQIKEVEKSNLYMINEKNKLLLDNLDIKENYSSNQLKEIENMLEIKKNNSKENIQLQENFSPSNKNRNSLQINITDNFSSNNNSNSNNNQISNFNHSSINNNFSINSLSGTPLNQNNSGHNRYFKSSTINPKINILKNSTISTTNPNLPIKTDHTLTSLIKEDRVENNLEKVSLNMHKNSLYKKSSNTNSYENLKKQEFNHNNQISLLYNKIPTITSSHSTLNSLNLTKNYSATQVQDYYHSNNSNDVQVNTPKSLKNNTLPFNSNGLNAGEKNKNSNIANNISNIGNVNFLLKNNSLNLKNNLTHNISNNIEGVKTHKVSLKNSLNQNNLNFLKFEINIIEISKVNYEINVNNPPTPSFHLKDHSKKELEIVFIVHKGDWQNGKKIKFNYDLEHDNMNDVLKELQKAIDLSELEFNIVNSKLSDFITKFQTSKDPVKNSVNNKAYKNNNNQKESLEGGGSTTPDVNIFNGAKANIDNLLVSYSDLILKVQKIAHKEKFKKFEELKKSKDKNPILEKMIEEYFSKNSSLLNLLKMNQELLGKNKK